jgi:outer membrane protein OmpA-like peptidoglycan-associated protein
MQEGGQTHWIPLSDLMTGLMMIFMLVAAAFMLRVEQTTTMVVVEYQQTREDMELALQKEFADDLKKWNAELLGDMTIRFNDPTVLFATGSATLNPKFKAILSDFFPRYTRLVFSDKFRPAIKEVRIEGHTSTFWHRGVDARTAYFRNMELSQLRTRTTLEYVMGLERNAQRELWLRDRLTANGLSSSKPVRRKGGEIDELASQRVEFRIVTNAEDSLERIAGQLAKK